MKTTERGVLDMADEVVMIRKALVTRELDPLTESELMDILELKYCTTVVIWGNVSYDRALEAFQEFVVPGIKKARNGI